MKNWAINQNHQGNFYTYSNGDVYEGSWKYNKKHGQGKCTHANGAVNEGSYIDDKIHGQGNYTYANGAVYEGGLENNKRHTHTVKANLHMLINCLRRCLGKWKQAWLWHTNLY